MAGSSFQPGCTLMCDSKVGDQWIREVCQANPTVMLPGEGRLIQSGPVRLAFVDTLFEPKAPSNNPGGTPKYSVAALYTPFNDMNVYYSEYYRICGEVFPDKFNPHTNSYAELENPFHDCALKAHKFAGYTPGLLTINHTSKFKPGIYDSTPARNPIVDRSKVYAGVWAILVLNAYHYGKFPVQPKKGVGFGLQAIVIIADDMRLDGSGGVDPRVVFAGVNVKPPMVGGLGGLVPPPPGVPTQAAPPVLARPPVPAAGGFVPPGPPNPLHAAMAGTVPAADDPYDLSSLR